jgi:hypothetical protein
MCEPRGKKQINHGNEEAKSLFRFHVLPYSTGNDEPTALESYLPSLVLDRFFQANEGFKARVQEKRIASESQAVRC